MEQTTVGFIGCGHLATAIMQGMLAEDPAFAQNIYVSNHTMGKLEAFREKFPVHISTDNAVPAKEADLLFLTIKPSLYPQVLAEIKSGLRPSTILVSVAAGVSIASVEDVLGRDAKIIRCMPNTPSLVGEGMSALCPSSSVTDEDMEKAHKIFGMFGKYETVEESLFDTVTGVSGSGPAYVYMFIDAMAKAAEKDGMDREKAVAFAAQTALGAAKMVLESGTDPQSLTESVCSPGGTTIEAVKVFREDGLYELVEKAQHACVEKSRNMGK